MAMNSMRFESGPDAGGESDPSRFLDVAMHSAEAVSLAHDEFRRRHATAELDQRGDLAGRDLDLRRELGMGELGLGRDRLGLDRERMTGELGLGRDRLGLERDRMGLDRELGMGRLGLDNRRTDIDRDLGFGRLGLDRDLGMGRLGLDRDRMDRDFGLGLGRLELDRDRADNEYDLGDRRLGLEWYGAGTTRGTARSQDWERRQRVGIDRFRANTERRRTRPQMMGLGSWYNDDEL